MNAGTKARIRKKPAKASRNHRLQVSGDVHDFLSVPQARLCLDSSLMKYCRFHWNGDIHYGLVESVAGRDEITRLLVTPPEEVGGDMEDLRTKRTDHIPLAQAELTVPVRPSKIV